MLLKVGFGLFLIVYSLYKLADLMERDERRRRRLIRIRLRRAQGHTSVKIKIDPDGGPRTYHVYRDGCEMVVMSDLGGVPSIAILPTVDAYGGPRQIEGGQ